MKSIFTSLVGISLISLTSLSCTKDAHDETTRQQAVAPQVIKADVQAGQTYVLNMGSGTTASIVTQAQYYQLSEIAAAPNSGSVYRYIAQKGFAGMDEVVLQQTTTASSTMQSGGCHNGNHTQMNGGSPATFKTIAIKFNVAN